MTTEKKTTKLNKMFAIATRTGELETILREISQKITETDFFDDKL